MYVIDQNSKTPLYIQLYNELKKDILNNLKFGDKLPSIRELAVTYKLSKNTVQSAYAQLYAEGYIQSRPKSGYFVCELNHKKFEPKKTDIIKESFKESSSYRYDFRPVELEKGLFPLMIWKRVSNKALENSLDFGSYRDGQGEFELREEIARYLIESRGVNCSARNIIICNSFIEAMGIVAKNFRSKYDTMVMEKPGYYITDRVFGDYGYSIKKVGVDKNGLILEDLKPYASKLLYITPSHQYPTGVTMPVSNRQKLLKWAKETDSIIIEDDYDSELSYINRPIPSLQGLDVDDRVVYFGTFSKSLSPALRVCYLVVPKSLLDLYKKSYDSNFSKVSFLVQKSLALFLKEGYYDRHLRKLRNLNRKKHNILKRYLKKYLKDTYEIEAQGCGLSIVINPKNRIDFKKLNKMMQKEGIKLYFASSVTNGEWEAIRMGFGGFKEDEIEEAVKEFAKVWFKVVV